MSGQTEDVVASFSCEGTPNVNWTVNKGTFDEALNTPFTLRLQLATEEISAIPIDMLGKSCRVSIQRGMLVRQITGVVSQALEGSSHNQLVTAEVVVRPALEALRHRTNTRVFQQMTVPVILDKVLTESLGAYDRTLDIRVTRTYPTCEYRVQYNETDLAFCSRLMAEEGIAYWFEFGDENEVLILSDNARNFGEVECLQSSLAPNVLQFSLYEGTVGGHEYVTEFHASSEIRPTKLVSRHYDWTHPSMPYEAEASEVKSAPAPNGALLPPGREVYEHDDQALIFHEYDGMAYANNDMQEQVTIRREAQATDARICRGRSTALGVTAGKTFELLGHQQGELDGEYLILSVSHSFDDTGDHYLNTFECIPSVVSYRPATTESKPRLHSIQTATVVGPANEEIHVDEHGRVKVQFHWDRLGARDEHSSCWIRVMQSWSGAGWGSIVIPRIGMEVVVNFVNGDPDQPLIMGTVYNGDNPPPYPLPQEKTKSTFKTNSSLGGGGFNELCFEDKKDAEEIFIHAEKDFNEIVEHNHYTLVHNHQTNEVDKNHTELIHENQRLTVDEDRIKHIKGNEATKVDGNRSEQVGGNEGIKISKNRSVNVMLNDSLQVGMKRSQNVNINYDLNVGNKTTIKTGDSQIILKRDGTIIIKGKNITIDADCSIKLKSPCVEEN